MPSAPTLRTLERAFALLAWAAFGLGAAGVLGLCAIALLSDPPFSPEKFLARLAIILAATLIPTALFRVAASVCRGMRMRSGQDAPTLARSFSLFEDSTLGK